MPPKKIDVLRAHMAAGEWREAVALASTFGRLGGEKRAIMGAREAFARPEFQRQLGKNPDELIAAGVAALKLRYSQGTK
jgi:hypothetical protein